MNFFKRCIISMKRNLSKTLPLFLVAFLLGNVLCTSFAIYQSTLSTKEEFESKFGTQITFEYQEQLRNKGYLGNTKEYQNVDSLFRKMNEFDYYQYSNISYLNNSFYSGNLKYKEKDITYYENDLMQLFLWGISNETPIDEKKFNIELVSGRHFTSEEMNKGERVVLVSENFNVKKDSELENVEIGDMIEIDSIIYADDFLSLKHKATQEYKVIGIYKRTDNIQMNEEGYSEDNNLTNLYIPLNTLKNEVECYRQLNKKYDARLNVDSVPIQAYFQLKDMKLQDKFNQSYANLTLDLNQFPNDFYINTSNEMFEKIGAPISLLSNVASTTLIISVVITIIVLMLLIFILLRNRKFEIGILYALGEKQYKIVLQMLLEVYLVGIIALSLSTFSGCAIGQSVSTVMIQEENKVELTLEEQKNQQELFELYKINYSVEYFIYMFTIGSMVMAVSVVLPIRYILRLEPKKILM